MLLRTLGGLELEGVGFRRPKPLLLLAYLALEGPQERGHLAELFFRESENPRASLSVTLSRLRRGVPGAVEADGVRIRTPLPTDAQRLLAAVERDHTGRALELYCGPFAQGADIGGLSRDLEEWIAGMRDLLAVRAQTAWLRRAEAAAGRGRYREAAEAADRAYRIAPASAEVDTLMRLHPLLLAGGSPSEAAVREDSAFFGLPLCATRREAVERLRGVFGAGRSEATHSLPTRETAFVGRDVELAEIADLLGEHRLVTLLGPGGVGKSRLALEAARQQLASDRFSDGIHFVALDALTSPEALPRRLAGALELELPSGEDPAHRVRRFLADRSILLVLDNFEHLVEGATFCSELLAASPRLGLLVTSRRRLNLAGEWCYRVRGLSYPREHGTHGAASRHFDAVRLFVGRARQADPAFSPGEDEVAAVLELCRLVDGLPLALELAATWVRATTCREIVRELATNLDILSAGPRDVPGRHAGIRVSFEHSWRLLAPRERTVLRRLAVFRGGFRRDAAAAVAEATLPMLAGLVDRSLLRMSRNGRYDRHPLLDQYTREKLAASPDEEEAREHHAHWYLEFVERAANHLGSGERGSWLDRLEEERDNIRAALDTLLAAGESEAALRLATAASYFWSQRSHFADADGYLERALALPGADRALRARAAMRAGTLKFQRRAWDEAERHFAEGLRLFRALGDRRGVSAGLDNLGNIAASRGDHDRARPLLEESLALRRELRLAGATGWSLMHLAGVAQAQGAHDEAERMLCESLDLFRGEGDALSMAWALDGLSMLEQERGEYASARTQLERALELRRAIGDREGEKESQLKLGRLARIRGDGEAARKHLAEGLRRSRELGIDVEAARVHLELGDLALERDDAAAARTHLGACLSLRRALGDPEGVAEVLERFGHLVR